MTNAQAANDIQKEVHAMKRDLASNICDLARHNTTVVPMSSKEDIIKALNLITNLTSTQWNFQVRELFGGSSREFLLELLGIDGLNSITSDMIYTLSVRVAGNIADDYIKE